MRNPFVVTVAFALVLTTAGRVSASGGDDPAYVRVTQERAAKIVRALELDDADARARVEALVAQQYRALSRAETEAAAAVDAADKDEAALRLANSEARVAVADLHCAFLGALAAELTAAQIDQVKDGLTYGVAPLTYRVYQDMLPTLTAAQKRQILAWLIEAREHAMDAGSSEEKHRWFGKYKGRINNFLSAAGIDMKQAERDFRARQKAQR